MDVFEAIEKRTSVRSFKSGQIDETSLESVLYAAQRAPRIGSLDIIVLQDGEKIKRISDGAKTAMIDSGGWNRARALTPGYNPLYEAPTVIMLCGSRHDPFVQTTIGIAVGMMIMAATALGLGSVTVSSIRHGLNGPEGPALRSLLGLSGDSHVILALALGYPDDVHRYEMKGACANNIHILR